MILFQGVGKSYDGQPVLQNVNWRIGEGQRWLVSGISGIGKTTLLRLLMGLETPDCGRISGISGVRFAPVFQENRLVEHWSALENVGLVCPDAARVREILTGLLPGLLLGGLADGLGLLFGLLFQLLGLLPAFLPGGLAKGLGLRDAPPRRAGARAGRGKRRIGAGRAVYRAGCSGGRARGAGHRSVPRWPDGGCRVARHGGMFPGVSDFFIDVAAQPPFGRLFFCKIVQKGLPDYTFL